VGLDKSACAFCIVLTGTSPSVVVYCALSVHFVFMLSIMAKQDAEQASALFALEQTVTMEPEEASTAFVQVEVESITCGLKAAMQTGSAASSCIACME